MCFQLHDSSRAKSVSHTHKHTRTPQYLLVPRLTRRPGHRHVHGALVQSASVAVTRRCRHQTRPTEVEFIALITPFICDECVFVVSHSLVMWSVFMSTIRRSRLVVRVKNTHTYWTRRVLVLSESPVTGVALSCYLYNLDGLMILCLIFGQRVGFRLLTHKRDVRTGIRVRVKTR